MTTHTTSHGATATANEGIQRVLGRPGRDFADDARDAAATGAWNQE